MDTPIRVLHVDDDPSFTELVVTFLEREEERIEVTSATSGDEGLSLLADRRIDCVVSDYDMPGESGIEFLESVREDDPGLPFILYTGKGSETVASRAIAAGVTDYLQKGIGSEQYELLANRITNAVAQRRSEQRARNLERIRRVITNIDKALSRARTRDEIEERICRIISDADPYLFAWIGTSDPDTDAITGSTSAGIEEDYLETIELTTTEQPSGQGPTGAAFRSGEMVVVQNIAEDETYEPWRADALDRGYESSAAIPLVQGDSIYGVLNVYADRIDAFDEEERELLEEIADDAVFALDRVESRERLEAYGRLVDNLPVGVYRATSGQDGEVIDVNPALVDMMNADSPEQLEGTTVSNAYQDPAERSPFSEELEETGLVEGKEFRLETLDGEEIWASVTAMSTEEHGEVYFDGVIQDISEQKKRERELSQTQAFIEDSLDALQDIFFVIDDEMDLIRWNHRVTEVSGYTDDEIRDMGATEFFPDEHHERILAAIDDVLERGYATVQADFLNEAGERIPYELRATCLKDPKHDGVVIAGIGRDISEQEAQRGRLEQFASVVSHDLRNPLHVARGNLELLANNCDSEHVATIEDAHERMETLIEDVLTLTRSGSVVADRERVDLSTVMARSWASVVTGEATFIGDFERTILADESRLRQVFENLFRNAIDHRNGPITVTAGDLANGFFVEDDGPGIPEGDRQEVFEAGTSTSDTGTGFGLNIVKQIVEAHDWEISLTESADGGARFEITGVEDVAD